MPRAPLPTPSPLEKALPVIAPLVAPVAAFLVVSLQAIVGRQLSPLGDFSSEPGRAATFHLLFALLLGAGWSVWLARRTPRIQSIATALLALVAVVAFHLPAFPPASAAGNAGIFLRLALGALPALVLLTSAPMLVSGWLRLAGRPVPAPPVATAAAGALLALILDSLWIEPRLELSDQRLIWHGLLALAAGLIGVAAYSPFRLCPADRLPGRDDRLEQIPASRFAAWLALAAVTAAGVVAAADLLRAEIGTASIVWLGPLGAWLFSFMLVFAGRWCPWMTHTAVAALGLALAGFANLKGFTADPVAGPVAWWLLALTACGSLVGAALLHDLRPARRPGLYCCGLVVGTALGALAALTIVPLIFFRPVECVFIATPVLALGLAALAGTRRPAFSLVALLVLLAPVLMLGWRQTRDEHDEDRRTLHFRNTRGTAMVALNPDITVLSSATTIRASQVIVDDGARRLPTLYYTENSGAGRVITNLRTARPSLRVGIVGLGAGTLASYSRTSDTYDFWEADPLSLHLAQRYFSYIKNASGVVNLYARDGRRALAASEDNYDLIIIDTLVGPGGIPSRLLTQEALSACLQRLAAREGLLLIHASLRHADLDPVMHATADSLGYASLGIRTAIASPIEDADLDPAESHYILIGTDAQIADAKSWFPETEGDERITRVLTPASPPYEPKHVWTDQRHSPLDALDLASLLLE